MTRDNTKFKKYYNDYEPMIFEQMKNREQEKDKVTDDWLADHNKLKKENNKQEVTNPAKTRNDLNKKQKLVSQETNQVKATEKKPSKTNLKKVQIYARGSCDYSNVSRTGKYAAILCYKGNEKTIAGKGTNTTDKKMLIQAVNEALAMMKEPCYIEIYTNAAMGMTKALEGKKSPNADLKNELLEKLKEGNHQYSLIPSEHRQSELKKIIDIWSK